jgi:hypothetical protein
MNAVLAFSAKNTSGKIPFLLFLFFGKAKKTKNQVVNIFLS